MHVFLLFLAALSSVYAAPAPPAQRDCRAVDDVVQMFDVSPEAAPFCRSFLPIDTVYEQSTTIKTNTVTASDAPVVPTITHHVSSITVRTTTIWTKSVVSTRLTVSLYVARLTQITTHAHDDSDPACTSVHPFLQSFPSAQVSTACECLSLPTPTSTILKTRTTYSTEALVPTTTVTSTQTAWSTVRHFPTQYISISNP